MPGSARARSFTTTERKRSAGSLAAASALTILLTAAALVAPLAGADHVYSHRYVVTGRVVDADGDPVAGLAVPVGTTGFRKDGHCAGTSADTGTTDEEGTFYYCLHTHVVHPEDQVRIRVAGAEYVKQADPELRATVFLVYAPTLNGTPRDADANRTYVVTGKVWQGTRDGLLDGVPVHGVALEGENVTVRLEHAGEDATTMQVNATTDAFGEYVALFQVPPDAEPERVAVEALDVTRTFNASATFLFTRADVAVPGDGWHPSLAPLPEPQAPGVDPGVPDEDTDDVYAQEAPGTDAPAFIGSPAFYFTTLGLAAVALVALGYVTRRERLRASEDHNDASTLRPPDE